MMEPREGFGPSTSSLPRKRSSRTCSNQAELPRHEELAWLDNLLILLDCQTSQIQFGSSFFRSFADVYVMIIQQLQNLWDPDKVYTAYQALLRFIIKTSITAPSLVKCQGHLTISALRKSKGNGFSPTYSMQLPIYRSTW